MCEIWKCVVGYEGLYKISNKGRVIKILKGGKEKIVKTSINSEGYVRTSLTKNKKTKQVLVHRLVAEAFIPNLENKPLVNHKNSNRSDNNLSNLEWATHKENNQHAYKYGSLKGRHRLLTKEEVNEIRNFKSKDGELVNISHYFSKKFNVSKSTITAVLNRTGRYKDM